MPFSSQSTIEVKELAAGQDVLLNEGITALLNLLTGAAEDAFSNANSYLGVCLKLVYGRRPALLKKSQNYFKSNDLTISWLFLFFELQPIGLCQKCLTTASIRSLPLTRTSRTLRTSRPFMQNVRFQICPVKKLKNTMMRRNIERFVLI